MRRLHRGIAVSALCALTIAATATVGVANETGSFADFELRLARALETPTHVASAIALPFALPAIEVRTFLRALHLLGLCAGLGSVIVLDVLLVRAVLRGRFEVRNANMLVILARVTSAGLVALWLSGLGFLALYWIDQPELLANPKILAKVVIVAVLTLNGYVLHAHCLPRFQATLDQEPLLSMPKGLRTSMIAAATVSAVSWYAAFALGLLREFNGTVPAETILLLWALTTVLGFLIAQIVVRALERKRHGLKAAVHPKIVASAAGGRRTIG